MSTQSQEVVAKAITAGDALANAGKLSPEQGQQFVDYVANLTKLSGNVRLVSFRNEQMEINEVSLGRRVAMSHREAADPQRRRGVSHNKITIQPFEMVVPFEISERYLAHNLQGRSMEDYVVELMARQFANDREDLFINGNTLGHASLASDLYEGGSDSHYIKDDYLAGQQGWSELSEGGVIVDAGGANISPAIFSKAMQELPEKFQRDMDSMRFLLPTILNHKYNEKISQRQTAGGDAALAGANAPTFGIPRIPVPLWNFYPVVTEHVTLSGTTAVELKNAPIHDIVAVTSSTLDLMPTSGFVETTDYVVDLTLGTIARVALGGISDGATVKVTYHAFPQMLFTNLNNLIIGVGLDIVILRGQEIFKNVQQYAMHCRVGVQIQNVGAVVKVKNIGNG